MCTRLRASPLPHHATSRPGAPSLRLSPWIPPPCPPWIFAALWETRPCCTDSRRAEDWQKLKGAKMPDAARLGAAGPISRSPRFVIPSDGKNVGHDGIWGQRRFGARRKAEAKAQAGDEPFAFFCKSSGVRVKTLEPDSASHVAMNLYSGFRFDQVLSPRLRGCGSGARRVPPQWLDQPPEFLSNFSRAKS